MQNIHPKNQIFLFLTISIILNYLIFFVFYFSDFIFFEITKGAFLINYFIILIPLFSSFFVKNILYKQNLFSNKNRKFFFNIDSANIIRKFFLVVYMAIILEALVFLVDLSFSLITDHIHFSTDFNILLQKYSQIWTPKKIDVFKKFASDFSVQFFWMLNVFVGIIVGVSSSAIFFWLEFIAWFGFLWNELKYMSFWEKSLYMGFFRGIIYAPFTFVGYFGKSKNYILLAFVILAFYVLITPILAMIYKKTKSIIYPSIFNGIIFSTSVLSTFFIVGADELIIGFYGLAGIFVLLTANVVLYYFYIKNFRIISKK